MFNIMFDDLKEEIQKQLLEFYKINNPKEMNWDVIPIMQLPEPEGDEDDSD